MRHQASMPLRYRISYSVPALKDFDMSRDIPHFLSAKYHEDTDNSSVQD
jgi:hypothetical protein